MEKHQPSLVCPWPLETLLMERVTRYGLPVLALTNRQKFVGIINMPKVQVLG
jgi:hypothetical protein